MSEASRHDAWQAGDSYDMYMGRWSRRVAPRFLEWLDVPPQSAWLDVGCGTGALSGAIVSDHNPRAVTGIDPSAAFVAQARRNVPDNRASFEVGDAQALPHEADSRDVVVSALVLNFVPDKEKALAEMARVARPSSTVAFYVWDYPGGGIEFMRAFWTAAVSLDAKAAELTEGRRFAFCTRDDLVGLARVAGLAAVEAIAIEVPTTFKDFDDFWHPFTLGAGPAPGYCVSLDSEARERLRARLEETLPRNPDGSIPLHARAWAVKGRAS